VSSLKNSQRPHGDSRDLRILKIGPKEQPFGSGYDTSIRRWAMRQTELSCRRESAGGALSERAKQWGRLYAQPPAGLCESSSGETRRFQLAIARCHI
jgi:hypothetical protein